MLEATGLQSAALPIGRSLQNKSKVCGGRIRTFEVCDGRFTVCSLWPLGNPSEKNAILIQAELNVKFFLLQWWCWHQESNPGPTDYKSVALPAELWWLVFLRTFPSLF